MGAKQETAYLEILRSIKTEVSKNQKCISSQEITRVNRMAAYASMLGISGQKA